MSRYALIDWYGERRSSKFPNGFLPEHGVKEAAVGTGGGTKYAGGGVWRLKEGTAGTSAHVLPRPPTAILTLRTAHTLNPPGMCRERGQDKSGTERVQHADVAELSSKVRYHTLGYMGHSAGRRSGNVFFSRSTSFPFPAFSLSYLPS
jgi:hypothetical protein